jgi:hypothetical protein
LWLQRRESADSDGQVLGRLLGAAVVLLIADGDSARVRIDGRDIAVLAAGDDDVRPIIPLLEARVEKPTPPLAVAASDPAAAIEVSAEPPPDATGRTTLEYGVGISLVVVGTGALVTGWVLYGQRYSIRSRDYGGVVPYETTDHFERLGTGVLVAGAFGAGLLMAAEPFLVSDDGIPGAAWVLAAGGLALAGAGFGFGLAHHCEPKLASQQVSGASCGFVNDATFGPLLALHGAPLLALPAMYWLRQLVGGGSTVVLGFNGTGGHIAVSGTF